MNALFTFRFPVFSICLFLFLYQAVQGMDKSKYRNCDQTGFCRRARNFKPEKSAFEIISDTVNVTSTGVEGSLLNSETLVTYNFLLQFLADSTIRLRINEEKVVRHRYQPLQALVAEPAQNSFELVEQSSTQLVFKMESNKIIMYVKPFKIECYNKDELVIVANDFGRFIFEHHRPKPEGVGDEELNKNGEWEERFHEHSDTKPFGPMSVAMDFSFPSATHVYGLASHADNLALKSTSKDDPYRLYNTDVFEYELYIKTSLYGAIPFLISHGVNNSAGVFWLNAAETWIDIEKQFDSPASSTVVEQLVNLVSGSSTPKPQSAVNAFFMSETGIYDVFFTLGPRPYDVMRQYSRLTGTAPLPPYFSLGYHQSRWNYVDQQDVKTVAENFDVYDIPMDVMWLDIEYTHEKKYFTWDPTKFSEPIDMINALSTKGRKLVTIIDPHIKRDTGYWVHNDATQKGLYVKNRDRNDYDGWCWPGSSGYLDFLNPETASYYSNSYSPEVFKGSNNDVYIWNDMNEPSVFSGPEGTMPKDNVHHGEWEHRDIHNIYGFFQIMLTYDGLVKRSNGQKRPFILTRSFFAGIQRYGAMWTGDNLADWEHLKISVPMCLSMAIGGVSFCGADVGGFFKNPDPQLLYRWYQTGIYLPFFRAHAHIDTKRREPWLFDKDVMKKIREAIRERQSMMPFWYTVFYEHSKTGAPVIRPLFMEFPTETATFDIDNELLIGNSILVRPIAEPDVSHVDVYFPGTNEIWYNKHTFQQYKQNGVVSVPVTSDNVPVYIRGGHVVPYRNRIRRSAILTLNDPYTLLVALDANGTAFGHLYVDDGDSFDYRNGKYCHLRFVYLNNQLMSQFVDKGRCESKAWIEKVIIVGIPNLFRKAIIASHSSGNQDELELSYNTAVSTLTIRKPAVPVNEEWTISLH